MFCSECGTQCLEKDKFCSKCGTKIGETSPASSSEEADDGPLTSSKNPSEILSQARSVYEEYEGREERGKSYRKSLENKWGLKSNKQEFQEALQQKAIVRFEGNKKPLDEPFTEICFAEEAILFIAKPGLSDGGIVLKKNNLIQVEVDKFIVRSSLGISQWTQYFWRMHFVTTWADLDKNSYAEQANHSFGDYFKMREGEFAFYLPAGKTEYQQSKIEEVMLEKLDTLAAFYEIYFEERTAAWNRSVGIMFGTGFWREIGD